MLRLRNTTLISLLLSVAPAWAEPLPTPLSGEEFENMVTGKTYYSSQLGQEPYGMLLYRDNREVTWANFGDECVEGSWSEPLPGVICFYYPDWSAEYCWQFFETNGYLTSTFHNGNGDTYFDGPTEDTMPCLGPYLGA